nr:MAG TPA: hypothetical protein [Caudoviricetes sp.]
MTTYKNNGSPNANQYDPRTTPSHHSIAQSAKKCKQNLLRDLRVTKKIPAKEMIDLVREHYPKYDKALQSKCEHGDEYNTEKAVANQIDYALQNDVPFFSPSPCICFRCHKDIFSAVKHDDGSITGITVQQAATRHITCCPHCHCSFVD